MKIKTSALDKLFSLVIREAGAYICEICSKQSPPGVDNGLIDCSHDRGRRHRFTRWHPDNVIVSCRSCHFKTTEDHDYHVESFRKIKGQEVRQHMRELSNGPYKLTAKEVSYLKGHYQNELKRIKQLRLDGDQTKITVNTPEQLL